MKPPPNLDTIESAKAEILFELTLLEDDEWITDEDLVHEMAVELGSDSYQIFRAAINDLLMAALIESKYSPEGRIRSALGTTAGVEEVCYRRTNLLEHLARQADD